MDSTKYQYTCPLCKKLGNVFIPYVECDSGRIEVRESSRSKAVAVHRKKMAAESSSAGAGNGGSNGDTNSAVASANVEPELPVAFLMDMTHLDRSTIPIHPYPTATPYTTTVSTTSSNSSNSVWSWMNWIRHPSMLNQDMSVYYKYTNSSSVSFHIDPTTTTHTTNELKRMRSATSDSADLGRVHTKLNTNSSNTGSGANSVDETMDEVDSESEELQRAGTGMYMSNFCVFVMVVRTYYRSYTIVCMRASTYSMTTTITHH